MGKVKKNKNKISNRHNPLDQEILENRYAQSSSRNKIRRKQPKDDQVSSFNIAIVLHVVELLLL